MQIAKVHFGAKTYNGQSLDGGKPLYSGPAHLLCYTGQVSMHLVPLIQSAEQGPRYESWTGGYVEATTVAEGSSRDRTWPDGVVEATS